MLHFKSPADLKQLPATHPAYPLIKDLVERLIVDFPPDRAYAPKDDGWIALIEESDVDQVLSGIWPDTSGFALAEASGTTSSRGHGAGCRGWGHAAQCQPKVEMSPSLQNRDVPCWRPGRG
jgi:hypothetical protein